MSYGNYQPVIGLEIHAQLLTKSKMFSPDSTAFGSSDNENTDPVSVGMPGALPTLNRKGLEMAIRIGLALNCEIRTQSVFARKHYFYPDLPKGYQISQYERPISENGFVEFLLEGERKRIRIERAHMEEDAGKSIHEGSYTLINLNRAGVPLVEIVSGPDLRTPAEAAEYGRTVRRILRYLEVCDGNLEEGSMRCDCNVSVMKKGDAKFGTKVEIKNINSFRFIEKAIEYEIHRQIQCLESGTPIVQETRLYDSTKNSTFSMRSKEEAQDYRYFPDPDLLAVELTENEIKSIRSTLPELPLARFDRFVKDYQLPEYDAAILTQEKDFADYYEAVARACENFKAASNWIMGELLRELNEAQKGIIDCPISSENLAKLIRLVDQGKISGKIAKTVFAEMWKTGSSPDAIVEEKGMAQISDDSAVEKFVDEVIANHPNEVAAYRSGKQKLFGFFVGQVMKLSKGQVNPELANKLIKSKLEQS